MKEFEDYIYNIENHEHQKRTAEILNWIESSYPTLEKAFKWSQPMFVNNGTFIISLTVTKGHINITPEVKTIQHFSDAIQEAGYKAGKMTFNIKWTQEVNYELLSKMIEFNIEDKADVTTFWRK